MLRRVARARPDADVDGVVVQERVVGGVEVLLSISHDGVFGPAVTVGAGGVLVELVADVATALAPLDRPSATELVDRTAVRRLLNGVRGAPPADADALISAVVRLSELAWAKADRLASVELNPIIVNQYGAVAVDAIGEEFVPQGT
jgi:acetyltransferase